VSMVVDLENAETVMAVESIPSDRIVQLESVIVHLGHEG